MIFSFHEGLHVSLWRLRGGGGDGPGLERGGGGGGSRRREEQNNGTILKEVFGKANQVLLIR